jgi:thiaminase/transcriptional activator TenA
VTTVQDLAARDPERWRAATTHPFLVGAADGTLPPAAFDTWLAQDRLFVEGLARAWARLLVRAPAAELPLLADGIAAFVTEVTWLEEVGATRGVPVPADPGAVTAAYDAHLQRAAEAPLAVALPVMWAVEAAYLAAWRSARPGAPAYRAFVEHWSDEGFADFVARLEAAADRALAGAPAQVEAAADAVARTLGHEAAFWAMAWGEPGGRARTRR